MLRFRLASGIRGSSIIASVRFRKNELASQLVVDMILKDPTRILERIVISVSPLLSVEAVSLFPWTKIDAILDDLHHPASVDILRGSNLQKNEVELLSARLEQSMTRANVHVRHTLEYPDAATLEPQLFKRPEWDSDISSVFAIDPIGRLLSAPKYVRL